MKLLTGLVLLGAVTLSQSTWADTGPYYVSYPGYCNIKKIYLNTFSDVYGTEVGCVGIIGAPLLGSFTVDGKVVISTIVNSVPCLTVYGTDGTLVGACSAGGPISYTGKSTYTVQEVSPKPPALQYIVSAEMPDLEKSKDLPQSPM